MIPPFVLGLLSRVIPLVIAASVGFMGAWYVQGLRVTEAKQALTSWQQAAVQQQQEETARTTKLNEEVSNAWSENLIALRKRYAGNGVQRAVPGSMPSGGLSVPTSKPDAPSGERTPDPEGTATIDACAADALQVMFLQSWILGVGNK
jgi:hypothetical protein